MKKQSISVVIPVYNEVRTISSVIQIVLTWGKAKEIIVVNDGSTDQTAQAVSRFHDFVTIISYSKNYGKGARFATLGVIQPFNTITGERVVYKKDIELLSRFWKKIGYGVEVMINEAYKRKRVLSVKLPYVYILSKLEKQVISDAMISYIREGMDMLTQIVKDQADSMKPHARRIIQTVITYLQEAIS
ncbi:MAG: Glycosyl transferase [Candidatus Gottesmanbacteria bacterium GW2011_GWB1_44_11c]|uniref:Glycosyl transferase n=1 Tax=Candidatus Gottesmanbacteria bacterium GW2011_GWB1_44_11c TaxID=1618447 RepID=A0A0G1GJP7_9BACT|nr:MAG: Glycosyl transferase [Candidatus Gottesmanbacteria bacterium GW2011_GWB1_44_11c]